MSKAIEYLNSHQSSAPSTWRGDAQWRKDNEKWLRYSRNITVKVMKAMDTQSITQTVLAQRMGCTQQYVSNILKGNSNMTLETISRIEDALNIDLIQSLLCSVDGYTPDLKVYRRYLNDIEPSSTESKD